MPRKRIKKKTGSGTKPDTYKPVVGRLYLNPEADREDALLLERFLSFDPDCVYTKVGKSKKGHYADFRNEDMTLHKIEDKAKEYPEVTDYMALGSKISTLIELIFYDKPDSTLLEEISGRNNIRYYSVSKKPGNKHKIVKIGFSGANPNKVLEFVKKYSEKILSWNIMCQQDGSITDSSEYGIELTNKLNGAKELPKKQEGGLSLQRTYPLSGTEFKKSYLSIPGKKGEEVIKELKDVDVSDFKMIYPSLERYLKEDDFFELHFLDSDDNRIFRFGPGLEEKEIKTHIDSFVGLIKKKTCAPGKTHTKKTVSRRITNKKESHVVKKKKKKKVTRKGR